MGTVKKGFAGSGCSDEAMAGYFHLGLIGMATTSPAKDGRIIGSTIVVKAVRRADRTVEYFVALPQDLTQHRPWAAVMRRASAKLELRVAERQPELGMANEALRARQALASVAAHAAACVR
jgi:hypothetical protein